MNEATDYTDYTDPCNLCNPWLLGRGAGFLRLYPITQETLS